MRKELVLTKKEFQEVENAIKAKMWFQYFFGGINVCYEKNPHAYLYRLPYGKAEKGNASYRKKRRGGDPSRFFGENGRARRVRMQQRGVLKADLKTETSAQNVFSASERRRVSGVGGGVPWRKVKRRHISDLRGVREN